MFEDDKYLKMFESLKDLSKNDMSLKDALKVAREANPAAGKALARHIFTDTLCSKVGNAYAFNEFLKAHHNDGVHLSVDANSFGAINKEHGFEHGNEAIKTMFNTMSEVSRKYGLKAFRKGGDEGHLHAPTPDRALAFIKEFREKLAQQPKIAGKHQVSVSIGVGHTPEHAEKALIMAKDQLGPLGPDGKRVKVNPPGHEISVFHSLLHESPPPHWRPAVGKAHEPEHHGIVSPGLTLTNPLKQ